MSANARLEKGAGVRFRLGRAAVGGVFDGSPCLRLTGEHPSLHRLLDRCTIAP